MNIIIALTKEKEKGNTIIMDDGNIFSPKQVDNCLRKEYKKGVKDDIIDFEKISFKKYSESRNKDFLTVDYVLGIFCRDKDDVGNETVEENNENK